MFVLGWERKADDPEPRWLAPEALPAQPFGGFPDGRPILSHADWRHGLLRAFLIGSNPNWVRWGMSYEMAVEVRGNAIALGWTAAEGCLGRFSTSGTYVIATPIRNNGTTKGRSYLLELASREVHEVALPRGLTKFQIADHATGVFWLRSRDGDPSRIAIARVE